MCVSHSVGLSLCLFRKRLQEADNQVQACIFIPYLLCACISPCQLQLLWFPFIWPFAQSNTLARRHAGDWCTLNGMKRHTRTYTHTIPDASKMKGTVVMPQAAGHPALQMNTLQCIALHLSVHFKTSTAPLCVCGSYALAILFCNSDCWHCLKDASTK